MTEGAPSAEPQEHQPIEKDQDSAGAFLGEDEMVLDPENRLEKGFHGGGNSGAAIRFRRPLHAVL
jgi:hypothetical protein